MDDFEDRYNDAVEAGQRNLRAIKLLRNWCFYAEVARSPGRGMIEAATDLPIGHMGVQCKFSKKNSMHSWLLEDSIFDFYQNNCKNCKKRVPVNFPNILDFVDPREKAAEKRKRDREQEEKKRVQKQSERKAARAKLHYELSLEESFVLDLLDDLDREDISNDDPRLEQLANLAPETFTRKIIDHLLPEVLYEQLPYSMFAAKALFRASLEREEKLLVAVRMVSNNEKSPEIIDVILSNAEELSQIDLKKVLRRFVWMALAPPPGMHIGRTEPMLLDAEPIHQLYQKRQAEIGAEVEILLSDANPAKIEVAIEIILAIDSNELFSKHLIDIFAKLMRRRTLLPGERSEGSSVLYYLRKAASKSFKRFPEEADKIIQSFLEDNDHIGRKEAYRVYSSVLKCLYREQVQIGIAERIAFRRLLWAAVENPENNMDDSGQFFRHSWDEYAQLAVEHFDDLIGAAATLSEKYEQVDTANSLELTNDVLAQMDRRNKRSSIDSLQGALIEWAAIGAKSKGREGIEQFLNLYRRLPDNQTQMRGNMILHVSKLLTGVESLKMVLSDWYRALMDESALVRGCAVQAWKNVPYDLVQNFPDLFFDAFSVLLNDPYVFVHKSVVHSLGRRSFPEDKRGHIIQGLWILIVYYSQENKKDDFIVDCIDVFASLCLVPEERTGGFGLRLSSILLSLEGNALYHAVDRLHYGFKDVPGFVRVALKSIQDGYTRSISIDDCASVILKATSYELQKCISDLKKAFEALRPFKSKDFVEAVLYATALSKAGDYAAASACFGELIASIPKEDRYEQWRLEASLIEVASKIEHAIGSGEAFSDLIDTWCHLSYNLDKENEERAKLRDFPSSFFFEK
ncbi:MAG: hypothetical protein HGB36_05690 [Chlorobiaceae bacterium]|nr:hypothetical protein [Chlorobiaceae bacterium]